MKKLPAIDLAKEVRIRPFNFTGEANDEVRGLEILQQDDKGEFAVKIRNYFRDYEKKENINGFPSPEGDTDTYSKDDWKVYFLLARKFLVNYTKENVIPRFGTIIRKAPSSYEEQELAKEFPKKESVDAVGLTNEEVEGIPF